MSRGLGTFAVLALLGPLISCGNGTVEPVAVAREPAEYVGRTLTVEGPLARVVTGRAFLLGSGVSEDDSLLVVTPEVIDLDEPGPTEARRIRVTGEVRAMRIAQIAESFGGDWDDQLNDWDGRVALFAESVSVR